MSARSSGIYQNSCVQTRNKIAYRLNSSGIVITCQNHARKLTALNGEKLNSESKIKWFCTYSYWWFFNSFTTSCSSKLSLILCSFSLSYFSFHVFDSSINSAFFVFTALFLSSALKILSFSRIISSLSLSTVSKSPSSKNSFDGS